MKNHRRDEKLTVFIDMDGVIVDFEGSKDFLPSDPIMRRPPRLFDKNFFENLEVLDGAEWGIRALLKNPNLDVHILSQPVEHSSYSYSEKARWICKYFPELVSKITLTQNKEFLSAPGRILIDDADWKWKVLWEKEGGEFLHFDTSKEGLTPDMPRYRWVKIVDYLTDYYSRIVDEFSTKAELEKYNEMYPDGLRTL